MSDMSKVSVKSTDIRHGVQPFRKSYDDKWDLTDWREALINDLYTGSMGSRCGQSQYFHPRIQVYWNTRRGRAVLVLMSV